MTRGHDIER